MQKDSPVLMHIHQVQKEKKAIEECTAIRISAEKALLTIAFKPFISAYKEVENAMCCPDYSHDKPVPLARHVADNLDSCITFYNPQSGMRGVFFTTIYMSDEDRANGKVTFARGVENKIYEHSHTAAPIYNLFIEHLATLIIE